MVKKKGGKFYSVHVIEKSLRHHVIEWVATILSICAALLNTNILNLHFLDTYSTSFYVYFIADFLWISFALKHKHWGVFTTFLLFAIINGMKILSMLKIFSL